MGRTTRKDYKLGDRIFIHISKRSSQELVDFINTKENISEYFLALAEDDMKNRKQDETLEAIIDRKLQKWLENNSFNKVEQINQDEEKEQPKEQIKAKKASNEDLKKMLLEDLSME